MEIMNIYYEKILTDVKMHNPYGILGAISPNIVMG